MMKFCCNTGKDFQKPSAEMKIDFINHHNWMFKSNGSANKLGGKLAVADLV